MEKVENFIYQFEGEQRRILRYLHQLLSEELHLEAKIRYKIPFYYGRTWICYLNPIKNAGIEFVFVRGNELSNYQGILDNRGRTEVAGIELYQLADIPKEERLGPGGLDPLEVVESLPKVMRDAFESRDVDNLKQALLSLDPKDAEYHMKRCIDSGLWVNNA